MAKDDNAASKPVGRPRAIESPEKFQELVDGYFSICEKTGKPVCLTGLILALGLSSRNSLDEYKHYEGFKEVYEVAKLRVEMAYEERLIKGDNVAGSIFALKNFGWKDKLEVDHAGDVGHKHTHGFEESAAALLNQIRGGA